MSRAHRSLLFDLRVYTSRHASYCMVCSSEDTMSEIVTTSLRHDHPLTHLQGAQRGGNRGAARPLPAAGAGEAHRRSKHRQVSSRGKEIAVRMAEGPRPTRLAKRAHTVSLARMLLHAVDLLRTTRLPKLAACVFPNPSASAVPHTSPAFLSADTKPPGPVCLHGPKTPTQPASTPTPCCSDLAGSWTRRRTPWRSASWSR